ncbi:MAG: exodeoxyribonuclease V subunit gamma [Desulfobacterales bacterium]|nr:exodeoxyribonuclease V subunit gamma [Desulfobacterales bacterium]
MHVFCHEPLPRVLGRHCLRTRRRDAALRERHSEAGIDRPSCTWRRGNRLLSSLGALGRDFFELLAGFGAPSGGPFRRADRRHAAGAAAGRHPEPRRPAAPGDSRSRRRLHSDPRLPQPHAGDRGPPRPAPGDVRRKTRSCARSDIVVMAPDIAAYAPYISAVFGVRRPQDRLRIPFSIADRGPHRRSMRLRNRVLRAARSARAAVSAPRRSCACWSSRGSRKSSGSRRPTCR